MITAPVTTKPSSIASRLRSYFFKARYTFETLYGSDRRFAVLAIFGDTPTDPTGLVAQVRETVGFLEDPKVATPDLDILGIDLDPPTLATQLTADADALDRVLAGINAAEKQADVTREARNTAIEAYDEKFPGRFFRPPRRAWRARASSCRRPTSAAGPRPPSSGGVSSRSWRSASPANAAGRASRSRPSCQLLGSRTKLSTPAGR